MPILTLVTGNQGKLAEWQRLVPPSLRLEAVAIDLDEIQTLDMEQLITDKARRAYQVVGKPVIVEDIAAGLDRLGGLPGPFVKFFEKRLGDDALFKLALNDVEPATVICIVAYYDGSAMITARAELKGSVVPARGEHGFGFDKVFVPAGQDKTYGEMTPDEKDAVSHRAQAVQNLLAALHDILV